MDLFDDHERVDASPVRHSEDAYAFLNRASGVVWERIRTELEGWFAAYPSEHADDLRSRFRSKRPAQHYGAWWELYLFTLFNRIRYAVEVHPEVPDTPKHPDFELTGSFGRIYVEAATVFSGIVEEGRHGAREGWILDAINEEHHPNFFVGLEFDAIGLERPSTSEVTTPIINWLNGLDPDDVAASHKADGSLPELRLAIRDRRLTLSALPVKPSARNESDRRLLGFGPPSGGYVNDREMLRKTLARKRGRYGQLQAPYILAVLAMSSFLEDTDIEQALFGTHAYSFDLDRQGHATPIRQPDGFWQDERGPKARSVSGVLIGAGVFPFTCAREWPTLWLNPWASQKARGFEIFSSWSVDASGRLSRTESTRAPHEVLNLPSEWPGPEPAFPRE